MQLCDFEVGSDKPFFLIAGPCVVESEQMAMDVAAYLQELTTELGIDFIYKSSYDKANRSSHDSYRGPGIDEGLKILAEVKETLNVPILTDVHDGSPLDEISAVVDVLQTPAFLCRQTDLLVAAAKTNLPVNVKKAQFVNGIDMEKVTEKVRLSGNNNVILTERGNIFGYGDYVVDMRNLLIMKNFAPVVFDATHSVQKGCSGGSQGSTKHYIEPLAKAAAAVGIDGLFLEVHDDPNNALSDGTSSIKLSDLESMLYNICTVINK